MRVPREDRPTPTYRQLETRGASVGAVTELLFPRREISYRVVAAHCRISADPAGLSDRVVQLNLILPSGEVVGRWGVAASVASNTTAEFFWSTAQIGAVFAAGMYHAAIPADLVVTPQMLLQFTFQEMVSGDVVDQMTLTTTERLGGLS